MRHSIRSTLTVILALLLVSSVALWALAVSVVLSSTLAQDHSHPFSRTVVIRLAVIAGAGLLIVLAALLTARFARRLSRDIRSLQAAARQFSDEQPRQLAERLRHGDPAGSADLTTPQLRMKITEVAQAAEALADMRQATASAAAGEARLRNGISQVFVSLARRNQSLLQRQLRLIDELERKAPDPAALAELFPLDHLTTRMRRHAEGLIILSGAVPGRTWAEPVPVIDVIRGAVAEVEDYKRVAVLTLSEDRVAGPAVADMTHLLAELIENATLFSPTTTRVEVKADRVANGFAIEIEDRGLGIKPGELSVINDQLATPPDFDLANADQLGLFVVGKLAVRHGVQVALRRSPYGGTTAIVLLPRSCVVPDSGEWPDGQEDSGAAELTAAGEGRDGGDGSSAPALALTGLMRTRSAIASSAGDEPGPASRQRAATGLLGPTWQASDDTSLPGPDASGPPGDAVGRVGSGRTGAAAGTHLGLPRRIRQTNLSPHLRKSPEPGASSREPDSRTPDQARDLMASLQSGWERGREAGIPDAASPASTQTMADHPSSAAGGEEA